MVGKGRKRAKGGTLGEPRVNNLPQRQVDKGIRPKDGLEKG